MTLTGKRALVTGASRGIGAAIAKALAAEGENVAITYEKSAERAAKVVSAIKAKGCKGVAIQADSADADAVQASVERKGSIHHRRDAHHRWRRERLDAERGRADTRSARRSTLQPPCFTGFKTQGDRHVDP